MLMMNSQILAKYDVVSFLNALPQLAKKKFFPEFAYFNTTDMFFTEKLSKCQSVVKSSTVAVSESFVHPVL